MVDLSKNETVLQKLLTSLSFDLNLIVTLKILLEERNVTRASERLCISQSAASGALSRLRVVFEDQLLIKSSGQMILTSVARQLLEPSRKAVEAMELVLEQTDEFDPAHAKTCIRIGAPDYAVISILPELFSKIRKVAPSISFDVSTTARKKSLRKLQRNEFDLLIGYFPAATEEYLTTILFEEKYVCIARKNHPIFVNNSQKLTLSGLSKYKHISIESEGASTQKLAVNKLNSMGINCDVSLALTDYLIAPFIIEETDLIAIESYRVALDFKECCDIDYIDLPDELGFSGLPVSMLWNKHTDNDVLLNWIRQITIESVSTM